MSWLRVLESVHGHLGLAAAIALLHPAILLRRGLPLSRGARWSVALTAAVVSTVFAMGVSIYPSYRALVKRELFADDARAGYAFETKEHLAFVILCLTLGAAVAALAAPPRSTSLRRAAGLSFAAAALACLAATAIGTAVASIRSF